MTRNVQHHDAKHDPLAAAGFDARKLTYPLDAVTFLAIRQNEPEYFNDPLASISMMGSCELFAAHQLELMLARKAFAQAAQLPDLHPNISRGEIAESLNEAYKHLRVSPGMHVTEHLIAAIETSARRQVPGRKR